MLYFAVIHKDADSDFGVTVPDLPGCFSAGDTFEDALANAQEAISLHLEGALDDDEPIPAPSGIEALRDNADYKDGVWAAIDIDASQLSNKATRVNITLPERLLRSADHFAESHHTSRSGLISQALIEHMSSHTSCKNCR